MLEAIVQSFAKGVTLLVAGLPLLTVITVSVRYFIGSKILAIKEDIYEIKGSLYTHVNEDGEKMENILNQLKILTTTTDEIANAQEKYTKNEIFFKAILKAGMDAITDVEKTNERYFKEIYGDNLTDEQKDYLKRSNFKASEYIHTIVDLVSIFSRSVLTVGVTEITEDLLTSNISNLVQRATVEFAKSWGIEHSSVYMRQASQRRTLLFTKIVGIATDQANNKEERFRVASLDFTFDVMAGFCSYYYLHILVNCEEGDDANVHKNS